MAHRRQSLIKGDKCGDPKCFHDEKRLVGEYIIYNGDSASTCQNSVVQCEIDWQYPYDGRT